MFFVHGGAFYGGTQIRMGAERLGAWDDVVVVAINYRVSFSSFLSFFLFFGQVGPLGFMCLDTDEAAGNMGMLDQGIEEQTNIVEWRHNFSPFFQSPLWSGSIDTSATSVGTQTGGNDSETSSSS